VARKRKIFGTNPSFKNGEKAFLISRHRGRRTITQVTIVHTENADASLRPRSSPVKFYYIVRSGNGGELTVPEDALTPSNALDRLLMETE
jgi:hypothetical protein